MHVLATVKHRVKQQAENTKQEKQKHNNWKRDTHLNVLLTPLKDGLVGVFLLLQARDHTS